MTAPYSMLQVPIDAARIAVAPSIQIPVAVATPDGHCELRLRVSGSLPGSWFRGLAIGCAERGISLLRGLAARDAGGIWAADLVLDVSGSSPPLPDFLALATRALDQAPVRPPSILDFELSRSAHPGERLVLEVHAWETVGLLAGVLGCAECAGLQPVEVVLETEDECAFHQITLVRSGGGRPTASQRRQLTRSLLGVVRGG